MGGVIYGTNNDSSEDSNERSYDSSSNDDSDTETDSIDRKVITTVEKFIKEKDIDLFFDAINPTWSVLSVLETRMNEATSLCIENLENPKFEFKCNHMWKLYDLATKAELATCKEPLPPPSSSRRITVSLKLSEKNLTAWLLDKMEKKETLLIAGYKEFNFLLKPETRELYDAHDYVFDVISSRSICDIEPKGMHHVYAHSNIYYLKPRLP